MSLVIDASLTMAWYFDDEKTQTTEELFDRVSRFGALVPNHWKLEVANALQMALRRRRVTAEFRDQSLADLAELPIAIEADTATYAWTTTVRMADRFGLTIYDATYLELANRRGLPLATLDRELRAAAAALDVSLLGLDP
ncbi:MAG TPA: type II toxin-antitoxin system VapC family toxin [Amaricoccus sp.]|nr:type II toxin-antitoxin system VapC family toxin [Amaricoccus sp.]